MGPIERGGGRENLWLISLRFISGEHERAFERVVEAADEAAVGEAVRRFLAGYYDPGLAEPELDDGGMRCSYFGGEVAVETERIEQLDGPGELVERLMM